MNPFVEGNETLYCISSGTPLPSEIEKDIMNAEVIGAEARDTFVSERLLNNCDFFKLIKRNKLKSMASVFKVLKVKSARQNKEVEYRQHSNVALQLLFHAQNKEGSVSLETVLKYPLTPVPLSV